MATVGYSKKVMEHFMNPRNVGIIESPSGHGKVGNPICGDLMEMFITVQDDIIVDIKFKTFGGHKFACGITIDPANIEEFKKRFNNIAKRELKEEDLVPKIEIDVDLPLSRINRNLIKELSLLAPYGASNPRPTFLSTGLQVVGYPSLLKNRHLKFNIREKDTVIKAIAFRNKRLADKVKTGSIVDIVYQPVENQYNNRENIELYIKDLKVVADL